MKKPTFKQLAVKDYKTRQSLYRERIYQFGKHKLKATIRRDSYDNQSYARMEIFDRVHSKWNFLNSIPYSQMVTVEHCSNLSEGLAVIQSTAKDFDKLKEEAKLILT